MDSKRSLKDRYTDLQYICDDQAKEIERLREALLTDRIEAYGWWWAWMRDENPGETPTSLARKNLEAEGLIPKEKED